MSHPSNSALPGGEQAYNSKATSLNQIPALFKAIDFTGATHLDIGCGRYDRGRCYAREQGALISWGYDPYWRTEDHNARVLGVFASIKASLVTCANVLNVIKEEQAREKTIALCARLLRKDGEAYFSVYEGDRSGEGRATGRGRYQNNRRLAAYLLEIKRHFREAERRGAMIVAKRPIL